MAPKTTKKSSLNTIPQTTSRQGDKQSQNQNPTEALSSDQSNTGDDSMYTDADEFEANQEEDRLPHSSQSVQEGLQQIIGNVVDEQRKRDAERKKKTRDSYVEDTQYMRGRIDEFFDEHEQQASSVHNDQLKRLQDLLAHKVQIESAMERELARLKADYDAHSKDLRSCIAHRIKEMQ